MVKRADFDPIISTPGVKMNVNIVNIKGLTPLFPLQAQKHLIFDI